ncbi:MAG: hypothetical protein KC620_09775, partial [Myxococcales bacterium]|nr:hypothetical protein [Myxococcales bacterium]
EPPEGPHFYWRLLGRRGMTGRFTDHELDTLLDLSADREGGHVVFTAATMLPDARRFAVLAGAAPSGSAEADED